MQAALIGALNGVIGDYLVTTQNPLAVDLGFYLHGKPVSNLLESSVDQHPEWKDTVCIFVHGAAASEDHWESSSNHQSYTSLLYDEFRILPALVRYNSGLHISENGRALASLIEEQLHHPSVKRILVIGHSMGGLVFRSACHYGWKAKQDWLDKMHQVFYLGSPHLGAPLEKFGAWAQAILQKIESPYTKTAAKLINIRSNGVKDLRLGYLTDEEWQEDEKHDHPVNAKVPSQHIYHLENAQHFLVAGTLHSNPESMLSQWFGDIMVRKSSALAECKDNVFNLPIHEDDILLTGGHHHVGLIQSAEVYGFIKEKIEGGIDR